MPFVSVVNNLFEKEDNTSSKKPENKETNVKNEGKKDTEKHER